jgi:membrane associated rhomboid family serine protease
MIFPFLDGFKGFSSSPVTWSLIFLNLVVFVFAEYSGRGLLDKWRDLSRSESFVTIQARLYAEFVLAQPGEDQRFVTQLAGKVQSGDRDAIELLSSLALRDPRFLEEAHTFPFGGDQVAVRFWRERLGDINDVMARHPSYMLGVNQDGLSLQRLVSYQFVHSGFFHFAGNMAFFAIFGGALEAMIGGLGLLIIYLGSGLVAAGFFVLLTEPSAAPLVGASGAIAGVMAFYALYMGRRPVRFILLLLVPRLVAHPRDGRYLMGLPLGTIYLPALTAWVMFFVADLAGYLGAVDELGGVAHVAHLGGQLAGLLVAVALIMFRRIFKIPTRHPESL